MTGFISITFGDEEVFYVLRGEEGEVDDLVKTGPSAVFPDQSQKTFFPVQFLGLQNRHRTGVRDVFISVDP